jgi:uridylate kinase
MKTIVLSLGGSVLVPSLEKNNIAAYARVLAEVSRKYRLFVVVGGGGEARRYISVARGLGLDEARCDQIGIEITRLNAALLAGALGEEASPVVARDYPEALSSAAGGRIVVMGGVTPAQTTDAVSAVLAEYAGADVLVNATAVDGIYTADPKSDPSASRCAHLTAEELIAIIQSSPLGAGSNTVIDLVAAKVIQRSGIPLVVVDGRDPEILSRTILKGEVLGSIVSADGANPLIP